MNFPLSVNPRKEMGERTRQREKYLTSAGKGSFRYIKIQLDNEVKRTQRKKIEYTLFFYKNIVFPAQAGYSYFSANVRLKIFFVNILI